MPRYRLDIEYDGGPYAGWQRQSGQHSVQAAIEQAIERFSGQAVTIRGAGRTDAGVHASGQVAHVDLDRDWPDDTVRDATNAHLRQASEAVSIVAASKSADDFDARFSAVGRHYLYRILNRRAHPALERGRACNQVRSMVGTLKRVGEGAWTAADVRAALDARDRAACGPVAPPEGLYLVKVDYPG